MQLQWGWGAVHAEGCAGGRVWGGGWVVLGPPCSPLAPTAPPTPAQRCCCVAGEEAALAQERLEWLRMRYVMAAQSSADTEQRMAHALEAASRAGPAQEDLQLWLGRVEAELKADDGRELPCSDQEKVCGAAVQRRRCNAACTAVWVGGWVLCSCSV